MGVFPLVNHKRINISGLPHARGGVSPAFASKTLSPVSSPRPWGCFCVILPHPVRERVIPTPVGVFLIPAADFGDAWGLPHARGGVSASQLVRLGKCTSSPRPWGCFPVHDMLDSVFMVFPTPVGVFPKWDTSVVTITSLPHARGGVSRRRRSSGTHGRSSPRPWGCFLCSQGLYLL